MTRLVISGYFLFLLTFTGFAEAQKGSCRQISSCKCVFDDGTLLDLTPLSRNDGKPFFGNIQDKNYNTYSWNPCHSFSGGSGCDNVAVCLTWGVNQYDLGTQNTAKFSTDSNGLVHLSYRADNRGEGGDDSLTTVQLRCGRTLNSDILLADTEQDFPNKTTVYTLILLSKHACSFTPTMMPSSGTPLSVPTRKSTPAHTCTSTGQCTQVSPCKCMFNDGTFIDLNPLSRDDGQPYFTNIQGWNSETYLWNPCYSFSYPPEDPAVECENVAVCMERPAVPQSLVYGLGTQDTAKFTTDSYGTVFLSYRTNHGDINRVTNIELRCSPGLISDIRLTDSEDSANGTTYSLQLLSKYACCQQTVAKQMTPPGVS